MKSKEELLNIIGMEFPESRESFSSVESVGRNIRYDDSFEVDLMRKFTNILWRDVSPSLLRYSSEAYYLFTDCAYANFLPSVLAGALLSYDDCHSALFCIVRDIGTDDDRRKTVFDKLLSINQLKVLREVLQSDFICREFNLYCDFEGKEFSSELVQAIGQLDMLIERRSLTK